MKFYPKTPESAFSTAFCNNFRPEVVSGAISTASVELVGTYIHVKFGDSRCKPSRDIRAIQFVMDDDNDERRTTTPTDADHHIRQNAKLAFA